MRFFSLQKRQANMRRATCARWAETFDKLAALVDDEGMCYTDDKVLALIEELDFADIAAVLHESSVV